MYALLLALTAAFSPLQAPAESAPQVVWKAETLSSPNDAAARLPNLVRGEDGVLYMTWVEDLAERSSKLRIASLGEDGWTQPHDIVQAKDLFLNWADFPGVAVLADGTLLAYWLKSDGTRHGYSAQVALSEDAGVTWSDERSVHDDRSSAEHGFVSVVPLDAQTFVAVWLDGRPTEATADDPAAMSLYSRTIASDGTFGAEEIVDSRVCSCCQTSLVREGDGSLTVAYRDRGAEEIRDISLAHRDAQGWSAPTLLREDGWMIPGCPVNGPQLASHDGVRMAAWFTGAGPGGGRVYAKLSAPGKSSFGFPVVVDNGSPVGRVDMEALGEGRALVTWLEQTEGAWAEWRAQVLMNGRKLGEPHTLTRIPNERSSGFLRMARDGDGVVAAWTVPGKPSRIELLRLRAKVTLAPK